MEKLFYYFFLIILIVVKNLKYLTCFSLKQFSGTKEMRNFESQSKWLKRLSLKRLAAFTSHKRVDRFPKVCSKIWPVRRDPYGHSTSSCSCSKKWHSPARLKFILSPKRPATLTYSWKLKWVFTKKKKKKKAKKDTEKTRGKTDKP